MRKLLVIGPLVLVLAALGTISSSAHRSPRAERAGSVHQVTIPSEDRFTPYAMTIQAGDRVRWVNNDTDSHFVASDDAFNTAGHRGFEQVIAAGGSFVLRFKHPGTFVYYCRFHARLDGFNQPVAPGPDGGIQDPNGNFGTPMTGVITVVGD